MLSKRDLPLLYYGARFTCSKLADACRLQHQKACTCWHNFKCQRLLTERFWLLSNSRLQNQALSRQSIQRHTVVHLAAMSAVMRAKRACSSALLIAGMSSEARVTDFEASVSRSRHSCRAVLIETRDDGACHIPLQMSYLLQSVCCSHLPLLQKPVHMHTTACKLVCGQK